MFAVAEHRSRELSVPSATSWQHIWVVFLARHGQPPYTLGAYPELQPALVPHYSPLPCPYLGHGLPLSLVLS